MTQDEINHIRKLCNEAKHSYAVVAAITNDSRAHLTLVKWPDVTDSIFDYLESPTTDRFSKITSDLASIIRYPLIVIAESYIEILERPIAPTQALEDIRSRENVTTPSESKKELIKLINILAARDERLVPIPEGAMS